MREGMHEKHGHAQRGMGRWKNIHVGLRENIHVDLLEGHASK